MSHQSTNAPPSPPPHLSSSTNPSAHSSSPVTTTVTPHGTSSTLPLILQTLHTPLLHSPLLSSPPPSFYPSLLHFCQLLDIQNLHTSLLLTILKLYTLKKNVSDQLFTACISTFLKTTSKPFRLRDIINISHYTNLTLTLNSKKMKDYIPNINSEGYWEYKDAVARLEQVRNQLRGETGYKQKI